jgi:hypothetical protein
MKREPTECAEEKADAPRRAVFRPRKMGVKQPLTREEIYEEACGAWDDRARRVPEMPEDEVEELVTEAVQHARQQAPETK